jgi:hypothetical protein
VGEAEGDGCPVTILLAWGWRGHSRHVGQVAPATILPF